MKQLRRFIRRLFAQPGGSLLVGAAALLFSITAHAAGGEAAHGESHLNWWQWDSHAPPIGWFLVNFALFVWLLVRFAGKPIKAAMAKRHVTIKSAIEENEALLGKVKSKYEETRGKLAGVEQESRMLVENTKQDGVVERDRIVAGANDYVRRMREDVVTVISQEEERAQKRLQLEVARLALASAEELLRRGITDADRERLFNEAIAALEQAEAGQVAELHEMPRRAAAGGAA